MTFCSIYQIKNNINGKLYIGQTWKPLQVRFYAHLHSNGCIKLARAIKKYGSSNFTISLITIAHTQEVADELEKYFIKKYDTRNVGYNIAEGGGGTRLSEAQKANIRLKNKKKRLRSLRKFVMELFRS